MIADNAPIHRSVLCRNVLSALCDVVHFRVIFLPFYSPEYNPCELLFGWVKTYIRNNRRAVPLLNEIVRAFASIPYSTMLAFYDECINRFV